MLYNIALRELHLPSQRVVAVSTNRLVAVVRPYYWRSVAIARWWATKKNRRPIEKKRKKRTLSLAGIIEHASSPLFRRSI